MLVSSWWTCLVIAIIREATSTPHTLVCCSTGMLTRSGRAAPNLSISNLSGRFSQVTPAASNHYEASLRLQAQLLQQRHQAWRTGGWTLKGAEAPVCPPVLQRLGVYRPVDLHLPQTYLRPGGVAQDLSGDLTGDAHRCAQQFARWLTPAVLRCRDIFTVRLTPSEQAAEAAGSPESRAPFVCPVTGLSCLRFPMSALPGCGHAFSSRALAQVSAPASMS